MVLESGQDTETGIEGNPNPSLATKSLQIPSPPPNDAEHDHLNNFDEFFDHLNRAAKSALPRLSRRYANTFVLLLRWEDDDLGTEREINELEYVLQHIYHYHTERHLIPSYDSTNQLEYTLNDFRRAHDNESNLLILYYGGHGSLESHKDRPSRSIWRANITGDSSLVWSDPQGVLERAKSDAVFILDCCFAATAARCAGSKEGLWACCSDVTTTGVNDNSFTRNLIEELKSLSASRFDVTMLHARLMKRYGRPGPHMLLTEPWYTYLGDIAIPSVELAPQPDNNDSNVGINLPAAGGMDSSQTSFTTSTATSFAIGETMTETLVLLAVRLKSTERIPSLVAWQNWCHNTAPEDIESVHALGRIEMRDLAKVEGHFLSHSTLLLISMPIFVWDRLPHSTAYSFIGFITSPNLHVPVSNFQLEKHLSSTVDREDLASVPTIEESSEAYDSPFHQNYQYVDTRSKMNLAPRFWDTGQWNEAEELQTQVIDRNKKVLEEEHPDTLISMNDLAAIHTNQGRWKEAEELGVQVVERRKRMLEQKHPNTLTSMVNLASSFWNQGRWKEAEKLEVQVIKIRERELGQEHPDTLTSIANLASTFRNQGRWKEAEKLFVEVIETRERVLGQEHPDTLTSIANLASTYHSQGRWKDAEELGVLVMETRKSVLGQEHPSTLISMANLALTYHSQERWKEAEKLEVQVIEMFERVLGAEHPDTLTSMSNLAFMFKIQSRNVEAVSLMERCFRLQEQFLGSQHPHTEASLETLNQWFLDEEHQERG